MERMVDRILSLPVFKDEPPVLIDIGASGALHSKWKVIAPYSVCIAFDADDREMGYVVNETAGFKKLYVYNRIAADAPTGDADFYLTRSPYCSSTLEPDTKNLRDWAFSELFEVEKVDRLKAVSLKDALDELGIKKVDWFKTDSQGTDLRLFKNMGEDMMKRTLAAEFEPGIIDAYKGEDKLWSVLAFMDSMPFWMSDIKIQGTQRISARTLSERFGDAAESLRSLIVTSPCWGEITYLNRFEADADYLDKRDFLLGLVIAVIERQYGFALEIAMRAEKRFGDSIFSDMQDNILRLIRKNRLLTFINYARTAKRRFKRLIKRCLNVQ